MYHAWRRIIVKSPTVRPKPSRWRIVIGHSSGAGASSSRHWTDGVHPAWTGGPAHCWADSCCFQTLTLENWVWTFLFTHEERSSRLYGSDATFPEHSGEGSHRGRASTRSPLYSHLRWLNVGSNILPPHITAPAEKFRKKCPDFSANIHNHLHPQEIFSHIVGLRDEGRVTGADPRRREG